jgi:hypothetical protein
MKKVLSIVLLLTALNYSAQSHYQSPNNSRNTGIILVVGGLGLTTSAILEGPANYTTGTTTGSSGNFAIQNQTTQPVYLQFPRNIMFTVGVSFTIAGLATILNHR